MGREKERRGKATHENVNFVKGGREREREKK